MFKKLFAFNIAFIIILLCGCSLLYMPHLDGQGTVYITPAPSISPVADAPRPLNTASLNEDVDSWPQQVLMDYADCGRLPPEYKQVLAEKVYGDADPAYIPGGYALYLPNGFSHYASHNSINVTLEDYENYNFNEKACTSFYLLVYDGMDELLQNHQESFDEGYGPAPEEYKKVVFNGYQSLQYTRELDGKLVYHQDITLTGTDLSDSKVTILRLSYVEGYEKSALNMLNIACTLRLL